MKKSIIILFVATLLASCGKEQVPSGLILSELESYDSTYVSTIETPQQKNVLIEEQTGASCPNCPSGSAALHDYTVQYPNRIVPVAIHSGFLTNKPSSTAKYEFFNDDSKSISEFLDGDGVPKPSAAFNRVATSSGLYLYNYSFQSGQWPSLVSTELAKSTPVNLAITSFQNVNGKIDIKTTIKFNSSTSEKLALTLLVTESKIIDEQKDPTTTIKNYEFNHVFRKLISPVSGFTVLDSLISKEAGRVFVKKVQFEPIVSGINAWNLNNCYIVAIVHRSGSSKEVLQVTEVKMK